MNNEKLLKRICLMISMSYALTEREVWEKFEETGSIDKTLIAVSSTIDLKQ